MTLGSKPSQSSAATEASLQHISGQLPASLVGGKLSVTDPSALPLPSGAATSAQQGVQPQRTVDVAWVDNDGTTDIEMIGWGSMVGWGLWQVIAPPVTGAGGATTRRMAVFVAAGGAVGDRRWQHAAPVALADDGHEVWSPSLFHRADIDGKLYLRIVPDAGTTTGSAQLVFVPTRTV